jgi:hypothetical protein
MSIRIDNMIWWPNHHYNSEVGHWVPNRDGLRERIFDARNVGDYHFYQGVRSGRLNRNEFIALQMYQAETERLRAKFLADGVLDDNERRILQERQRELDRLYNTYIRGDYYPNYQVGYRNGDRMDSIVDQRMIDQYGRIYDGIRNGELTYREYNRLDNNLEAISRYRGYASAYGWNHNPFYKPYIHAALDYNNSLLNYYNNNFERQWWRYFVPAYGIV